MKTNCWILILLLVVFSAESEAAESSIASQIESGNLWVEVSINPSENIVVRQEVSLYIEVWTSSFFAGPTKISMPEVPNSVVGQRSNFAVSSSIIKDTINYTVQRWELSIFPQVEGDIQVPAIDLNVTIRAEGINNVSGKIRTKPISFTALYPPGESLQSEWVTGTDYRVERTLDPEDFTGQPGEALQIKVTQIAEDTAPMMLPIYQLPPIEGVAVYPETPHLERKEQRGARTAIRIDTYNLMVEEGGTIEIPTQVFRWWDTSSLEMKEFTLIGLRSVSGEAIEEADIEPPPVVEVEEEEIASTEASEIDWKVIAKGVAIILLLVLLYRMIRKRRSGKKSQGIGRLQIISKIKRSLLKGNWRECLRWAYYWIDRHKPEEIHTARGYAEHSGNADMQHNIAQILQAGYAKTEPSPDLKPFEWRLEQSSDNKIKRWFKQKQRPVKIQLEP